MALSQLTTSTFEEVREAHPDGAKTLQLYVWRDRVLLKEVLDRAKEVGFTGLALTADFSWVGNRERETRTGFTVPPNYSWRQTVDAIKSPAWTFDYMSRVPYGYKAVPEADFPAESLVDFIAAQVSPRSYPSATPEAASPAPRPRLRSSLSRVRARLRPMPSR